MARKYGFTRKRDIRRALKASRLVLDRREIKPAAFRGAIRGTAGHCDEVDEFWIDGVPTSGAGTIGYTLDRDPNADPAATYDELDFDYNETAAGFQTQLLTHAIGDLTTADMDVFGGPWPYVSIYVRWKGNFGRRAIPFPSLSPNTLNNGAVIKMRKASAAEWSGF